MIQLKKILALNLCLVACLPASRGQGSFHTLYHIDTLLYLHSPDPEQYPVKAAIGDDNCIISCSYTPGQDSLYFQSYYCLEKKIRQQRMYVKGIADEVLRFNSALADMAFHREQLCLLGFNRLYFFKRSPSGELAYRAYTSLPRAYSQVFLYEDKVFLAACYPISNGPTFELACISIGDMKITKRQPLSFSQPEFAHYGPARWVCLIGQQVAVAEPHSYRVDFYDLQLNYCSGLSRKVPGWQQLSEKEYKRMRQAGRREAIQELGNKMEQQLGWLAYLSAMGSDTLLLDYFHSVRQHYVDVWQRRGKDWQLVQEKLPDEYPRDSLLIYTPANFCIENRLSSFRSAGDYALSVQPGIATAPFGYTPVTYMRLLEQAREKESLLNVIYVLKKNQASQNPK